MTLPLISMRQITKRFPGVIANNKINLELYPGEIHALWVKTAAVKVL